MHAANIRKTSGMLSLSGLALLGGFAAANTVVYDCWLVANPAYNAVDALQLSTANPLTEEDLQGALTDLRSYCCQTKQITAQCDSVVWNQTNAESPYIFDHFVSRGFFKLDNKIGDSKDAKADERATQLTEWEANGEGNAPVSLQETFRQTWQPTKRYEPRIDGTTCQVENYNSLDLAARYTAVCRQAACVTSKFFLAMSDLSKRYDLPSCETMAKKRIEDEMSYIQTLMVRQTNSLMNNVRESYTKGYMLETRRATLIDKFSRINESFSSVNGKVQEGTRMCSVK